MSGGGHTLRWYQREASNATWDMLFPYTGINPVATLPTGAGKSHVLADWSYRTVERKGRALILAHQKELLTQNARKIEALLPRGMVGIYSAGLKRRELENPVIVAGIQSIHKRAHELGEIHLVAVDEAHRVSDDEGSMYRTFLGDLRRICPKVRITGTTATPYRTGSGPLCGPDKLFHKVAYSAPVARLIAEGFLCPITTRPTTVNFDTSKLTVRNGEFVAHELANLFGDDAEKVEAAVREMLALAADRHSILIFASGVRHAYAIAMLITAITGDRAEAVTGESTDLERGTALGMFAARQLRYLVNVDVLTTGFDAPCIDCIVALRATDSPGLWAQICGRGFRVDNSKADCLILDYGGNFQRHGALDDPDYGRSRGSHGAKTGEAPTKQCPACEKDVHAAARECPCGFRFPDRGLNHGDTADVDTAPLVEPPKPKTWTVASWSAALNVSKKRDDDGNPKPNTMRVSYVCDDPENPGELSRKTIQEWLCIEHPEGNFGRTRAEMWWETHSLAPMPDTIAEALELFNAGACARPADITALAKGKFFEITSRSVGMLPETWDVQGDSWESDDEWAPKASKGSTWDEPTTPVDEVPF